MTDQPAHGPPIGDPPPLPEDRKGPPTPSEQPIGEPPPPREPEDPPPDQQPPAGDPMPIRPPAGDPPDSNNQILSLKRGPTGAIDGAEHLLHADGRHALCWERAARAVIKDAAWRAPEA